MLRKRFQVLPAAIKVTFKGARVDHPYQSSRETGPRGGTDHRGAGSLRPLEVGAQDAQPGLPGEERTEQEIMMSLPRTRPQRRSPHRQALGEHPHDRTTAPTDGSPPRLRSVPALRVAATPAPAAGSARRAARRRSRLEHEHEPVPGMPQLALDGAREAMKLPLKATLHFSLRALQALGRGLRG